MQAIKQWNLYSPKLLNLNQDHPSKKRFFENNQTFVTSTTWFESFDKTLLVGVMDRNYYVRKFISNTFLLRRPGIANSTGIIKTSIMVIGTILKESTKIKRVKKHVLKTQFLFVFPDVIKTDKV